MNKIELSKYLATGFCGRDINEIIVHCTATKPNVRADVATIDGWHKARGFARQKGSGHYCGYHLEITSIMEAHDVKEKKSQQDFLVMMKALVGDRDPKSIIEVLQKLQKEKNDEQK